MSRKTDSAILEKTEIVARILARFRELFMKKRELWKLFKKSFEEWYEDDPFQKAAALAYYTLFSLAPLLIILIGIVGLFSGTTEAQEYIVGGLAGLLGEESAGAIREMVRNANREQSGGFATLMGIVLLLFGAGGVLGQFQYSLNQIWGVKTKSDSGWWPVIRARVFSYAMLLVIGFLLLVSLVVTTVLSAMTRYLTEVLPAAAALWPVLDILVSFVFVTALFAMIYKVLPDVHIAWKDVWIGAAITALLFALGKFLIGLYLGKSGVSSTYGAAGSLVTILLWVYYSALVFFFGAEVTKVYATEYGSGLQPTEIAETTDDKQSTNPTAYSRSPR
jgi:membrane protein